MRRWMLVFAPLAWCAAETIYVPADVPTIQDALNEIAAGDTIYVDPGVYAEALHAPDQTFTLLGNVVPDTGDYPRPVVDPSSLPDPTTLACLSLPGQSHVVVKDFVFRNGPEMLANRDPSHVGGVLNNSPDAAFMRCLFDSTFYGVYPNPGRLTVTDCDFRRVSRHAINSPNPANTRIVARGCSFSKVPGSGGSCIAIFFDSSLVEDCWFKEYVGTSLIQIRGRGVTVRNCLFGAAPSQTFETLHGSELYGCRLENNTFTGLQVSQAVITLALLGGQLDDTCFIAGNTLTNIAGAGLSLGQINLAWTVVVEDNIFDQCLGNGAYDAIATDDAHTIRHNRFIGGLESAGAAVLGSGFYASAELHDNLFFETGRALEVHGGSTTNARENWWGAASGPYHETLNPAGEGDTVIGNADISSWYQDTLFFNDAPKPRPPLLQGFRLDAYPNPFNATATLNLIVPEPGIFHVDLYNLLGQHAQQIWSGPIAYEQQITFDGAKLSSGLYFIRVYQPIENRIVAQQKVVVMK